MKKSLQRTQLFVVALALASLSLPIYGDNEIEEQLEEIGSIPHQEIISVQKKYTRKVWRHELTPFSIGGVPFGTVRRTLTGGAGYTLHMADWIGWEANFLYTRNFFSRFSDDVNNNNPNPKIRPDIEKLVFVASTGLQITPWYGKMSTFSRWIVYIEPFFSAGGGIAKTDSANYFTFYGGLGMRVFFREWVSMKVDFRNYLYNENATGGTVLRSNFSVSASLSFWLPKMPG